VAAPLLVDGYIAAEPSLMLVFLYEADEKAGLMWD
jgi:hypothetical protein